MSRYMEHVHNIEPVEDYSIDRKSLEEKFSTNFLRRARELNDIVMASGEALEGGIFYWNGREEFADLPPESSLAPARRNYWRAVRFKKSILEVGVNAGHSALLALSANCDISYTGVDVCYHKYTKSCAEYLSSEFPKRFTFLQGDSREVLPCIAMDKHVSVFDLFHVDGGHTASLCWADISNCLRISQRSEAAHLMLDDINASWIYDVYCEFVSRGVLVTESFFGDWEDVNRNVLARIMKSTVSVS